MLGYKDAIAELHAVVEHLKGEGHALAEKVAEIWHALMGEATADAGQVAHDAETAAAPVVAEAEHDAEQIAGEAVAAAEEAAAVPAAETPAKAQTPTEPTTT